MQIEAQVLGRIRTGDIEGSEIPFVYWNHLRDGSTRRGSIRILEHNQNDLLAFGCDTARWSITSRPESGSGSDGSAQPLRRSLRARARDVERRWRSRTVFCAKR